jgi:hypothetical protein
MDDVHITILDGEIQECQPLNRTSLRNDGGDEKIEKHAIIN